MKAGIGLTGKDNAQMHIYFACSLQVLGLAHQQEQKLQGHMRTSIITSKKPVTWYW